MISTGNGADQHRQRVRQCQAEVRRMVEALYKLDRTMGMRSWTPGIDASFHEAISCLADLEASLALYARSLNSSEAEQPPSPGVELDPPGEYG